MRRWLEEGRVSADSLVWREGWPDWKPAGPVFPGLGANEQPLPTAVDPRGGVDEFAVATDVTGAKRHRGRPPTKNRGRNIAIVVSLTLVCAALIVALFLVLRGNG
jgi:hypothetical protein